ncbi:MAG: hypothetical protein METHAR1v1_650010 [Methanothrix sp.]|nr:MAG: hypothetical protein METHAR1v1_650010 [Methanothrix sp.]
MIFPADYKYVGVADEARPGDPIYFSTRYLIHFADEVVIYEVEQYPGEGFMRRSVSMEPIAGGSEILVYPEKVDTRNRTGLIELASSLCQGPVNTVIFKGGDEHVTFVHDPDPGAITEIEVLDVVPPNPSWLVSVIENLEGAGLFGDLALKFKERLLDLRQFEGDDVYFPCTASGLGKSLDRDRVDIDDPLIVGCEISREVFREVYPGRAFRFINTCPLSNDRLAPTGPFITRCCRSERRGIVMSGGHLGVVVHWGDGPPEIGEAIRCLGEELKRR